METHITVHPEPVEGLFLLYGSEEEGAGFDKLSPNGFLFCWGGR